MDDRSYRFPGVYAPTYTQIPDVYLDELLPILSGAEWKVLCYIARRTFGFRKAADDISLHQLCKGITTRDGRVLDRGTGLTDKTVTAALRGLVEKHVITATRHRDPEHGDLPTTYAPTFVPGSPWIVDNSGSPVRNYSERGGAETPDARVERFRSQHIGQNIDNNSVMTARTVGTMNKTHRKRLTDQELLELENRSIAESRVQS